MKENNKNRIVKELVNFVGEQKEMNRDQKRIKHVLEETARDLNRLVQDHEKWMRTHEVRLSLHYNLIRELRTKLK